jgi:hypothetical protein
METLREVPEHLSGVEAKFELPVDDVTRASLKGYNRLPARTLKR